MTVEEEMADAIVNDMIIDHVGYVECISCNSTGDYPGNIKHTSACIVLKAKSYLSKFTGD